MPRIAPRSDRKDSYTAGEAAELLGVPVERVRWHCARAAAAGRGSFFWGCWEQAGEWIIPARAMRRALGAWPLQHYSVDEVASLTGFAPRTIRARTYVVPAGMEPDRCRPPGMLAARLFFGSDLRIPESELSRLAAGLVGAPAKLEHPKTSFASGRRPGNAFGDAGRVANGGPVAGSAPARAEIGSLVVCSHGAGSRNSLRASDPAADSQAIVTADSDLMGGEGVAPGRARLGTNDAS